MSVGPLGPPAPRPAHLGHRPLQLPLRVLHAEGGLRARLPLPRPRASSSRSRRSSGSRARSRSLGVEKIRLTGGEPLLRRELETLDRELARIDARPDADDERRSAPAEGARARRRRADAHHRLPRLARRRRLPRDERRRLPRRARARRDRGRGRRRHGCRSRSTCVVKRGLNDHGIVDLARHFRGTGHPLRFIEYMDVGHTNGWRIDDVVPAAEIVARDRPRAPARAGRAAAYRGEVARRWRYRDGGGEVGVIASVTQPFCGDCTRARLSAEGASTPASSRRAATTCARSCAAAPRTTSSRRPGRDLGPSAQTATRSCAPPRPQPRRRSRCRTSAGDRSLALTRSLRSYGGNGRFPPYAPLPTVLEEAAPTTPPGQASCPPASDCVSSPSHPCNTRPSSCHAVGRRPTQTL